ncbi:hypothetical protein LV716_07405 [Flagellimonas sp. HMM57]|uniref:hypothetical protein n=1 Tax=unclassified Flagellimonas TaxID=2644544 RepID=UPI0013D64C30|nr:MULTISPECIES: hypothetical protein [unclassified Flagellimonas]MBS9461251.1 hypothetical protein [Flagellimonas sp. 389]UII77586.1 hypothetical protein LV716_07405 [Flagellimonas sp. HMM57]
MKLKRFILPSFLLLFIAMLLLQSCYSVRLRSVEGAYNPAAPIVRDDYYRDMEVIELDTTITIGATTKDFTLLIKKTDLCPSGKLHTVEYRNTLGAVLLSAVTFGRKRRVKIKYVCMKN